MTVIVVGVALEFARIAGTSSVAIAAVDHSSAVKRMLCIVATVVATVAAEHIGRPQKSGLGLSVRVELNSSGRPRLGPRLVGLV